VKLADFDFELPEELVAQQPLAERDASRMMVVDRTRGRWEHRTFRELPEMLGRQTFLAVNTTRVVPSRIWARRPDRAESIEVLLVEEEEPGSWAALVRPGRKVPVGAALDVGGLRATCVAVRRTGERVLRFSSPDEVRPTLERCGRPPLPPYIRRNPADPLEDDRERYQTIFATTSGSVAAPTAGLHFTPAVLQELARRGISTCRILLHVGYGTFQPIRTARIEQHRMHREFYRIDAAAASCLAEQRSHGRKLVAVGTTTTRALEHAARLDGPGIAPSSGWCDLFIYPGFRFQAVEGLLTNFHLPRSSLLLLVSAFAGTELVREAYRDAVRERYRFFTYGDSMLIL
jgi:S-adenosylmethionine:tRNA ribosyltransferase-isomerase